MERGLHGSTTIFSVWILDLTPLGGGWGFARYAYSIWRKNARPKATGGGQSIACTTWRGFWIHFRRSQRRGLWGSPTLEATPHEPLHTVFRVYCIPPVPHRMHLFPPGVGPLSQALAPGRVVVRQSPPLPPTQFPSTNVCVWVYE